MFNTIIAISLILLLYFSSIGSGKLIEEIKHLPIQDVIYKHKLVGRLSRIFNMLFFFSMLISISLLFIEISKIF